MDLGGMRVGFGLPTAGSWATPERIVEIAQRAETLGYSTLWSFQRLLVAVDDTGQAQLPPQYQSVLDPMVSLGFAAAVTRRCRLGMAVVNMPFASPVLLAKQLTTIDVLSNGRLIAGLGSGWSPDEFAASGTPMDHRGARADDFLRALDAIWTQDVVTHDGPVYRVPRSVIAPKPVQRPRPPVLLGGAAPAALARAGRMADGWISSSRADLTRIEVDAAVVRDAAAAAGKDPDAVQIVCRGVVQVRPGNRTAPLTGDLDEIRADLAMLARKGVTETFVDLNFDAEIGSPTADPEVSMRRAHEVLDALAPG